MSLADEGQVPLLLRRNPEPARVVEVAGGSQPTPAAGPAGLAPFGEGAMYWMAVRVEPVSKGLQVQAVMPGGPAAVGGLQEGDVLLSAAGRNLNSVDAFVQHVQASSGRGIQLELLREGKPLTLLVAPGVRLADGAIVMPQDVPAAAETIEAPPEVYEAPSPPPAPATVKEEPAPAPAKKPEPKADSREQALLQQLDQLKQHASELEKQIQTLKSGLAAKEAAEKARQAAEAQAKEEAAKKAAEMKAKEQSARLQAEAKAKEEAAKKVAEAKAKEEATKKLAEMKAKEEAAKKAAEAKKKEDDRKKADAKKPAPKKPEAKSSSNKSDDNKKSDEKCDKCKKDDDKKKSDDKKKDDDKKKSDDK